MTLRDGDLMTTGDVGKMLALSYSMIDKLHTTGRLRAVRTRGGVRLFWTSDVEALATERAKAKKAASRAR